MTGVSLKAAAVGLIAAGSIWLVAGCSTNTPTAFGGDWSQTPVAGHRPPTGQVQPAAAQSPACVETIMSDVATAMDAQDAAMTAALKVVNNVAYGLLPTADDVAEANAVGQRALSQLQAITPVIKAELAACPDVQNASGYDTIASTLTTGATADYAYQTMQTDIGNNPDAWLEDPTVQADAQTVITDVGYWQTAYFSWKKAAGR